MSDRRGRDRGKSVHSQPCLVLDSPITYRRVSFLGEADNSELGVFIGSRRVDLAGWAGWMVAGQKKGPKCGYAGLTRYPGFA